MSLHAVDHVTVCECGAAITSRVVKESGVGAYTCTEGHVVTVPAYSPTVGDRVVADCGVYGTVTTPEILAWCTVRWDDDGDGVTVTSEVAVYTLTRVRHMVTEDGYPLDHVDGAWSTPDRLTIVIDTPISVNDYSSLEAPGMWSDFPFQAECVCGWESAWYTTEVTARGVAEHHVDHAHA